MKIIIFICLLGIIFTISLENQLQTSLESECQSEATLQTETNSEAQCESKNESSETSQAKTENFLEYYCAGYGYYCDYYTPCCYGLICSYGRCIYPPTYRSYC